MTARTINLPAKTYKRDKMRPYEFILFVILPLLPLAIFWFIPMIATLVYSFTDWDYISPTYNIVGIRNYQDLLGSADFYQALKNTVVFGLGTVIPILILGFVFALLITSNPKAKSFFQSLLFSPWITPMVAMSIVWSWMFRPEVGLINSALASIGITGPAWLQDPKYAMVAVIIVTIWKQAGWAMLFYTDSMSKIPQGIFEVGDLEGANLWQRIRYIYLPFTKSTTMVLLIMNLINSIQAFDQISVLTSGGPAGSTRTLLYLFYQKAFESFNMGQATTVAIVIVIITAILAVMLLQIQRRVSK